jgi:hypothetical protein
MMPRNLHPNVRQDSHSFPQRRTHGTKSVPWLPDVCSPIGL